MTCITHHLACACREAAHTEEIARLEFALPFVRVAPWSRGAAGEAWPVKGKGATLKTRELAAVARALLDALDAANDGQSGGAAP
jgi:hypothetical protein